MNHHILYSQEGVQKMVTMIGKTLDRLLADADDVVIIPVLSGGVRFGLDLQSAMQKDTELDFIGWKSYDEQQQGDFVQTAMPKTDLIDKKIVIADDILETGSTIRRSIDWLVNVHEVDPDDILVVTLLKKDGVQRVKYSCARTITGFDVKEEHWVYGYGMDLDSKYRQLPFIAKVEAQC